MRKTYRVVRQGPNRKYFQPQVLSIYFFGWRDIGGWCQTLQEAEKVIEGYEGNPLPPHIAKGPFRLEKPAPAPKPEAADAANHVIMPNMNLLRDRLEAHRVDLELAARQRAEEMRRDFIELNAVGALIDWPVPQPILDEDNKQIGWWGK